VRTLLEAVPARDVDLVRDALARRLPMPRAHGVGRYFDAFGALFLGRRTASFEGQVAMEWDQAADPDVQDAYPFTIADAVTPIELDLRPAVWGAVVDFAAGATPSAISARFHNTLATATAALVGLAARTFGPLPVVASGGCFQNARLASGVRAALAPEYDVRLHADVPPGDGGIALGQAVIADAKSRRAKG
jgi:hydrogenase maturation protein HypF